MLNLLLNAAIGMAIQAMPVVMLPIVTSPVTPVPILTSPVVAAPSAPATIIVTPRPRVIVPPGPPAVRARAMGSLPTLFSTDDYPQAALVSQQQGLVAVAIAIGRDGRVTACDVTASSGSAVLDATTCSILQRRARFTPARDANGKIVEDTSSARIRWVLPALPPIIFADSHQRLVMTLDRAGDAIKCHGERSDNGPPPPAAVCDFGKKAAARVVAAAGRDVEFAGREIAIETGVRVGGSQAVLRVGRGAGERLVMLGAFDVEIDESGAVTLCQSADGFPEIGDAAVICAQAAKRKFIAAPGGGTRRATLYNASYTRPVR